MATIENNASTHDLRTSANQAEGQREGESKNGTKGDLSNGVPKPPAQLWYKNIKMLNRWNRHKPRAITVAPSTHGHTKRQESARTPTVLQPQWSDMATTGDEVDIELLPSNVNCVGNSSGNGSAAIENDHLTSDSSIAVQSRSGSPKVSRSHAVDHPAPKAEDPPVAQLAETKPVLASPPEVLKSLKIDTVADAVVPTVKVVSDKQGVKDGSDEANRLEVARKEQFALRHVYMSLEHCMKDYERMLAGLRIDMEDHKGCRRISVTCFAGATEKAKEIESILCKAGKGLQGFTFVVRRNEGTTIFGFKGPSDDATQAGDIHHHVGNVYNTSDCRQRRGDHAYSDTPYWKPGSVLVEIFCDARPNGNIAGAPLRMEVERKDGSSITCSWTCGGIVKVDGVNYGLTTAHPLVLSGSVPPEIHIQIKKPLRDIETSEGLFAHDDDSEKISGFFSMERHPESYWQAFGKVSHYALARIGSLPCNNDWLLFELPKDRIVWSDFAASKDPDQNALEVCTAHGVIAGDLQEGTAFLILGNSPFEVLKVALEEPLRSGDSGSWVMRGDELVGVMIGGSEENPDSTIGYAISADDFCRNISRSMGNVSVRLLTSLENEILAQTATQHVNQLEQLVALRIRQLFSSDTNVGTIETPLSHQPNASADVKTGNAALAAFLELGTFCPTLLLRPSLVKRYRAKPTLYRSKTDRAGRSLYREILQYKEGQFIVLLVVALSGLSRALRHICISRSASMLSIIMTELRIYPLPAPDCTRAVVKAVLDQYKSTIPAGEMVLKRADDLADIAGYPMLNMPYPMMWSEHSLARSLGRTLYALHTNRFFFHAGRSAKKLKTFLGIYTNCPVVAFDEQFSLDEDVEHALTGALTTSGIVPRIFLAEIHHWYAKSRFNTYNGEVVACDELSELLERMKTADTMTPRDYGFFEMDTSYDLGMPSWILLSALRWAFKRIKLTGISRQHRVEVNPSSLDETSTGMAMTSTQ